jgi:predicted nucleotidyltransferase
MDKQIDRNVIASRVSFPADWLTDFCTRGRIVRLSLFGSVLRDDFHDESDIDILVEYVPNAGVGYFEMMEMQCALKNKLGRRVDLRTPAELSKYFREKVVSGAFQLYPL